MNRIFRICSLVCAILCGGVVFGRDGGVAVSIAWSPDGDTIAVGSTTGVWFFDSDLREMAHLALPDFKGFPANTLDWNATGDLLALGYEGIDSVKHEFPIVIVDVAEQMVVSRIPVPLWLSSSIRWHPKKNRVMAGTGWGTTHVWDALTGKELFYFEESFTEEYNIDNYTQSVCWLADNLIATMGTGTTYIVDIDGDKSEVQIWSPYLSGAECNKEGDILMIGLTGEVGDIRADMSWEDMLNSSYLSDNEPILAVDVAWSPDGSRFVANGKGCLVHVFDRQSKALLAELRGSYSDDDLPIYIDSVAWRPDSSRFAVVGQFDIRMWDAETYELLHKFDGFEVGYHERLKSSIGLSEEERKTLMDAKNVKCP